MGTPANLETLATLGVTCDAGPTDVVIAVEGDESTLDAAERELAAPPARSAHGPVAEPPRSLGAATRSLTGANVALISIPGEYAVLEAHRALTAGLHVFLFSDHVSEADEVALKRRVLPEERQGCGARLFAARRPVVGTPRHSCRPV